MPAYRQKYSTAGREVVLPRMKAKKFVNDVSSRLCAKGTDDGRKGKRAGGRKG